jgi:hypothetical protein
VVSAEVVDISAAAGLERPNVGILSDQFLADVRKLKERNLAVEVLERLLKGESRADLGATWSRPQVLLATTKLIDPLPQPSDRDSPGNRRADRHGKAV